MRSRRDHDIIAIIGAGPAGSAAAFALASHGLDVRLIEQHRFPRDKVCGECLSALGIQTLEDLGLANRIRTLSPAHLSRAALYAPDGASATFDLPHSIWGLSRIAMDDALLRAARDVGAKVLQPARCESANGQLTVRDLESNTIARLSPDWTLLADGKSALLPTRPAPTEDLGVKAHFVEVDASRDTIGLFGVGGHYVGVAPVEGDRWNVAFSIPTAKLKQFQSSSSEFALDVLWSALLEENRALAAQFRRARRVSSWLSSPLPRFAVRRHWPPRVIPLGNAAAALEPIGGEGMGLALRSAALAADALTTGLCPDPARLQRQFASLWRTRRLASRTLARLLGSTRLSPTLIRRARGHPRLARMMMSLIGKT